MKWHLIITAVTVMLTPLHTVLAIHCYSCQTRDSGCSSSDPDVLEQYRQDCDIASGSEGVGFRVLDRCATTYNSDGELTRACFYYEPRLENTCKTNAGSSACICDTDGCNDGPIGLHMMRTEY